MITKADGGKFGKTESGNVWLDPEKTTPYAFYQFWLNTSDTDAVKYIKIFTLFSKKEVDEMVKKHSEEPHVRALQKTLAKDITVRVHGEAEYEAAVEASKILFGKATTDALKMLDERTFLAVFEGVPQFEVEKMKVKSGLGILEFLAEETQIFASKGEARRILKDNGVSIFKEKVKVTLDIGSKDLLSGKYILVQKGKKNYFLVVCK